MIRAGTVGAALVGVIAAACAEPIAPTVTEAGDGDLVTAVAPGGVNRGFRYEGCGDTYGTCALVVLSGEPLGGDQWRFRGYIENESYDARGINRNALLLFAGVGSSETNLWDGYSEFDCGGCNFDAGTPGPSVIFASFTGAFDDRCASNRRCRSLMFEDFVDEGPAELPYAFPVTVEFEYLRGRVFFDETVFLFSGWDPNDPVRVTQALVGGTARDELGEFESYELTLRGTAPLHVPRGLIARVVERRTVEQEKRHIASAAATVRRIQEVAPSIAR